jgi:hypothetical protein
MRSGVGRWRDFAEYAKLSPARGNCDAKDIQLVYAHVSFNQLHTLRKKSATDRRKWWEDLKRLQEGSLLCFVSFTNNKSYLLFLTVSEKRTDPNASYSLSSHDHTSTIVTKFATHNQRPGIPDSIEFARIHEGLD